MRILKYIFVASLVLLVAACSSRSPDPLIKEDVQASAQDDFELLKESTANAPMEIDLYQALAIAIKNNRELRIQVMDSALSQGQIDVVKFDMLPKLSANAGYKVLEKHPASTSVVWWMKTVKKIQLLFANRSFLFNFTRNTFKDD